MVNLIDKGTEKRLSERRAGYFESGIAAFKRISWGAVFGGLVIALVVQLMLSLLGIGVGMGTVDPLQESNPFAGLGIAALGWGVISMLLALFAGGLVAGRLAGIPRTIDSVLHGLLTFCLFTIVVFYLITTTAGSIVSGISGLAMQTLSVAGKGVGAAAGKATDKIAQNGVDLGDIKREARALLMPAEKSEWDQNNTAGTEFDNLIDQLFSDGDKKIDKEAVVNAIVARTGKSPEEANRIADNWIQNYQNAKKELNEFKVKSEQQAREAGAVAASATSKAGIFLFVGLVLGAAAAAAGGKLGEPHTSVSRTEVESTISSERNYR
ncbi:MAG: hypothetical protein QY310_15050 [Candidatus Jettenia sp. CY-1]|nr:hypothetical protein [Candidatus Jettenia sp.]WKZ18723.1 MAG: hypothetical protein QY310_15050 [Candidatus Jettenia sp. CY-1]